MLLQEDHPKAFKLATVQDHPLFPPYGNGCEDEVT